MFRSLLPASVLLAVLVAACSGTGATPAPTTAPVPTTAPATAATTAPSAAAGPTVSVSSAGFFVGPNGHSLYHFDKDAANTSNCQSGQCATNWPALALPAGGQISVGTGLTATDFSTITRTDGSAQVTFKQVPLYYFAGDAAPGDKNGDGVAGIWHLATTATVPPAAAPSSAPATGAAGTPAGKVCYDPYHYVVPCPSSGSSPAAGGGSTVSVSSGGYLVGPTGMSLYEFDKDTKTGSTACSGDCATNWPALTLAAGSTIALGTGLDAADFVTFTRSDNSAMQIEYYGKPLYYFGGDSAPGDTNGDGALGIWHLAKPQ